MRKWLLAALAIGALQAAVIRGVVVEHQSGKPLARTLVVVQPVAGTPGTTVSVRTNNYGAFEFPPLAGGAYLLSASRRSFAPAQYGQNRWKASGKPVTIEDGAATAITIRMQRFGSVSGTVLDENDVGMPEHDIGVYRSTRPPQLMAKDRTDDRGMFHIWGLEPGAYLVRTLGKQYDDAGYLPTFARETARVEQAQPVDVQLDQQVTLVNVRPFPGQLYMVAGKAGVFPPAPVTLTLNSDTGTETTVSETDGSFKFRPMPPGSYELTATAPPDRRSNSGGQAAWMPLVVDRDRTDWRINLTALPELRVTVEDAKGSVIDMQTVSVIARRKDISGEGKPETLRLSQGRAPLLPGRWDLALTPAPDHYVSGFQGPRADASVRRADGWNEVALQGAGPVPVKFTLSANPGTVRGGVASAGQAVVGAPVFLEAYDVESRRRLTDVRMTRTDSSGQYQFMGLAPGTYRILSTFEFQAPEPASIDAANPKTVKAEEGRDAVVQLDLYVIQ